MRLRPHTFSIVLAIIVLLAFPALLSGQRRKTRTVKRPKIATIFVVAGKGVASSEAYKREPYLGLEPCAKETEAQVAELENGADAAAQVNTLVQRTLSNDKWIRGCAIYRLGVFGAASTDALPVLLRIVDEEQDGSLWSLADKAIWNVPPSKGFTLDELVRDAKSPEQSKRLYAVFSLASFKYPKATNESKRTLAALIEALSVKDGTIVYIATRGIQRLGNWGEDTSSAIPTLSDLIRSGRINPLHALYAMLPMGIKAAPASPLLLEMLLEPEKFVTEADENNARAYSIRLTTEMVIGQFGSDFVPVLEKYRTSHPYLALGVLSRMSSDESLRVTLEMAKEGDPAIRAKAIESIPILKPSYAVKVIPTLLAFLNVKDEKIRNATIQRLGFIAKFNSEWSEDFRSIYKQVVPKILSLLTDKDSGCIAALNLAYIGEDANLAIPSLVKIARGKTGSYCAQLALYDFGEAGRKYLTNEQIKTAEESRSMLNTGPSMPKEIKPKRSNKARRPADSETY